MTNFQDQLNIFKNPLAKKIFEKVPQTPIPKLAMGEETTSITKPISLSEGKVLTKHKDII